MAANEAQNVLVGARALPARIIANAHMTSTRDLVAAARNTYETARVLMPQLPAFDDRNADGSAAVECCLRVRTDAQSEHVDRALFNIVTGDAAAISCLHAEGLNLSPTLLPFGATVAIRGYTWQLLSSPTAMAPVHSTTLSRGLELTVLSVRITADLVVPNSQLRLQATLALTFGGNCPTATAPVAMPVMLPPLGANAWPLEIRFNGADHTLMVEGSWTIDQLKQAFKDAYGPRVEDQRFIMGGRVLEDGHTLDAHGVTSASRVDQVLMMRGD